MSVKQKREQVLERLYDELLAQDKIVDQTYSDDETGGKKKKDNTTVQLVVALESARSNDEDNDLKEKDLDIKERDLELRGDILAFDNANKEIDREAEQRRELIRLACTAGVTIITNVAWGMIFVHELRATRQFEVDGTETSAAGRWLKQSFPKMKLF